MYMRTEMLKIIEGGLEKNLEKVKNYATLLSDKLREEGEEKFAQRILELISKKNIHPVYLDEFHSKPVDQDSRLDMVDVAMPDKSIDDIVLPEITKIKIDNYIKSLQNRNKIMNLGFNMPESLLLYGPPGCGKTSLAHYIAYRTGLPLITAKLDGIVSSLLGSTAKNLRRIFDYAKERPCILFLDEFDAIAKARNDEHEVGELKRVVNSLLQNIDDFNSSNNILIAATNHEKLLDPAVWRRFSNVIEVPKPSENEITILLKNFLKSIEQCDFCDDDKKIKVLANHLVGLSPSDVKVVTFNAVKNSVISREAKLTFGTFMYHLYLYQNDKGNDESVVKFLHQNGISQLEISDTLGISHRQVRKILSVTGGEKDGE